jgi:formamidase
VRTLSIAALQTEPVAGDPEATLARLRDQAVAVRATLPHAQLLLLPELHLAAPAPPLERSRDPREVAVDLPGPLTEALAGIARDSGLWLVPGTVYERAAGGGVHNTALVISPEGELIATYRKVFAWEPHEDSEAGSRFVTFEIPGAGRVGLAICYDASFPETFRQLAWMGAEVVLHMSLTTTSDRAAEQVLARANAIFNQLYVVSLNAAGPTGLGRSLIVDPEGIVRLQAGGGEELLSDVLDLDAVTRVREYGLAGVSRLWEQIRRRGPGVDLPMYEAALSARETSVPHSQ